MYKKPVTFYAACADIVSGIVIVISLIYALYEYNRIRDVDLSNVTTALFQERAETTKLLVTTEGLLELVIKAENGPDNLTPFERRKYYNYTALFYNLWLQAYNMKNIGVLSEEEWDDWHTFLSAEAAGYPVFAWTDVRFAFKNPNFVKMVDDFYGYKPEG